MNRDVIRTPNFVADAAQFILQQARDAIAERGEFRIALSGGNTPRPVYTELAQLGADLPWERVLSPLAMSVACRRRTPQSNYRMARESLFVPAAVPDKSVARMRGEIDPQLAAQEYQDAARSVSRPNAAK